MECFPTTFVRLKHLRFGHDAPSGAVNIRVPTLADGERLAPSILEHGLLQALCVWPEPGTQGTDGPFYTMVGGRRLMALRVLYDQGHIGGDEPISVVIAPDIDAASALAKSLIAEDAHVPPHPVDRFEAFTKLAENGLTDDDIAARLFIDKKLVRQAKALGALAPEIRELWRQGKITAQIAQNFTLADGHKQQIKVLDRLRKRPGGLEHLDVATVRKAFTGSEAEANKLLKFVGRDAYVAAGGALTEDLFTDSIVVHDFSKLKRLAEEKLEREALRLTKGEGWSFAEPQLKPNYMGVGRHIEVKPDFTPEEKKRLREIEQRQRELAKVGEDDIDISIAAAEEEERLDEEHLRIEQTAKVRAFTDKQKEKSGCVIRVNSDGGFDIDYGVVKPKEEPASPAAGSTAGKVHQAKPQEPPLDWSVAQMLFRWRNAAAGEALERNQQLALAAFLATMQFDGGPIALEAGHYDREHSFAKAKTFKPALAELAALPLPKLTDHVVTLICHMVGINPEDNVEDFDFVAALDQAIYAKALARRFDAKTYFGGASKPHLLEIVFEALGEPAHAGAKDKSKTDLAKLCVDKIAIIGWLPPELRTTSYVPPNPRAAAAPAAKEAKKPAAKKKPAKVAAAKTKAKKQRRG